MISIVLPIYNEEAGLASFISELSLELTKISENAEVIFVNDGSKDNSLALIKKFCEENKDFKYIDLSRNFGHQIAVSAGIDFAKGDKIMLIDSDGQDPPAVMHQNASQNGRRIRCSLCSAYKTSR